MIKRTDESSQGRKKIRTGEIVRYISGNRSWLLAPANSWAGLRYYTGCEKMVTKLVGRISFTYTLYPIDRGSRQKPVLVSIHLVYKDTCGLLEVLQVYFHFFSNFIQWHFRKQESRICCYVTNTYRKIRSGGNIGLH